MFEEVAQLEKDEFASATRDELINHISIQRTLIRNLYSKILEMEANPPTRGGSGRAFQSPFQQQRQQQQQGLAVQQGGAELELAAMNLVQLGANNASQQARQQQQQQAETPSRLQQLAEGMITSPASISPKPAVSSPMAGGGAGGGGNGPMNPQQQQQTHQFLPRAAVTQQPIASPTSPGGQFSTNDTTFQPQDAAVLAKLQTELSNVRNAIDNADAQGIPSSTVDELYMMEEQLIDAIANISRGPQGDEVELFRQGAYSRGMSTFTSATRDKATLEDVMLAQEGRFGTPVGSRSSTVRATPPRSAYAKSPFGRRRQASPHSSHATAYNNNNSTTTPHRGQLPSPAGRTSAAPSPSSNKNTSRPQAPYGAEMLETTSYVAEQRQTYRGGGRAATPTRTSFPNNGSVPQQQHSGTPQASGDIPGGGGSASKGPPLALLRKLQYRLQDGAGSGGGVGGGGGVEETASSIHLTTDSTTGQLVVNNGGGGKKTPTKQTAAERISAFRRGRNSTPRRYN